MGEKLDKKKKQQWTDKKAERFLVTAYMRNERRKRKVKLRPPDPAAPRDRLERAVARNEADVKT